MLSCSPFALDTLLQLLSSAAVAERSPAQRSAAEAAPHPASTFCRGALSQCIDQVVGVIACFQQLPTPRGVQALVFRAQYLAFFDRKAAPLETSVLLLGIT